MLVENQYQPLPNYLTIKESEIHGNGLFALLTYRLEQILEKAIIVAASRAKLNVPLLEVSSTIVNPVIAKEWVAPILFILLQLTKSELEKS